MTLANAHSPAGGSGNSQSTNVNAALVSPSGSAFRPYNTNSNVVGEQQQHQQQQHHHPGMMINGGMVKSPSIGSEISARLAANNELSAAGPISGGGDYSS